MLLFKGVKLLKVAKLALIGLSVASYAWLFSWPFAVALVASILWHEYGHVRAMKLVGIEPKGIWMIPFMGGLAVMTPPRTRAQEMIIAIGGPVFGLIGLIPLIVAYEMTGQRFWAGWAAVIALVNLINLLPIGMLDGGRMLKSIAFSIHSAFGWPIYLGGLLLGAVALAYSGSIVLALLLAVSAFEFFSAGRRRRAYEAMPQMTTGQWLVALAAYLLLAGAFVLVIQGLSTIPGVDLPSRALQD